MHAWWPDYVTFTGHTSWSTSGLGYVSLWLAGKLRIFDGGGHPWKLPVALTPLACAAWIGITRLQARPMVSSELSPHVQHRPWSALPLMSLYVLAYSVQGCSVQNTSKVSGLPSHSPHTIVQDYWHHWEDVAAGFCLGMLMAYGFYRLTYPPLLSGHSGEALLPPALEGEASQQQQMQRGRYADLEAPAFTEPQP